MTTERQDDVRERPETLAGGPCRVEAPSHAALRVLAMLTVLAGLALAGPAAPPAAAQLSERIETGLGADAAPAEEGGGDAAEGSGSEREPLPPVSELVPRVVRLSGEAERAIETAADVADVSALEPRVETLAAEQDRIASRLDDALDSSYVRDERVEAILEQALFLQRQVDETMAAAADRVQRLDALRSSWRDRRELWTRWRDALRDDPQYDAVYREQVASALGSIDRVAAAANGHLPGVIGLQQRLQSIDAANRAVAERARKALESWRRLLLERSTPPLLGREHRQALSAAGQTDLRQSVSESVREGFEPGGRHGVVLGLQIAAALLLGWALRRLQPTVPAASRWAAVLDHPWAIGVLVSAISLTFLYGPLPPFGRLLVGTVIAASTAMVAAGMFASRTKRLAVYAISGAYVLFAALEAVALPIPLLRLVLAGLALAGIPTLLALAHRSTRVEPDRHRGFRAALRLGAAALLTVLGAECIGYHALAQWLLEAAVVTAFIGFVATFLLRLGRGGIYLVLRSEGARRIGIPARIGGVLSDRLLLLLKVGIIGYGLLYLSAVWSLADSPLAAWKALVEAGISVGERQLTVGKLLLAVLVVYLAVAASWVLRALLDRAVFEQRQFERGIRDSISTLLHYSLLVVGVFLSLTLFGLDLSSLALIAGALSVGIGFGLQNVVNNFVSGLILLFERPVRVGDVAVVGEERGTISKIGMRSSVLTTFDGAELIVPNADLISEKVINWTLTTPKVRLGLPVSVAYGNDPERVIGVLVEEGRAYELALDDPQPMAIFTGFGDSSLDFELRVWLAAFDQILEARSALGTRLVRRLRDEGMEIPFPQRDVHLRSTGSEAPAAPVGSARTAEEARTSATVRERSPGSGPKTDPEAEPEIRPDADGEADAGDGTEPR